MKKDPYIKERLIDWNKIFGNLDNPVIFNIVGKFAKVSDVAKLSAENLESLLTLIDKLIIEGKP